MLKIIFHSVAFIEANCPRIAIIILRKTLSGWTSPELHSKKNPPSCVKNRKRKGSTSCYLAKIQLLKKEIFYSWHLKSNEVASGSDERGLFFIFLYASS
ncbi:uncharacterized protein CEXT_537061 [Caerostris extrusa]|uniref:Ycf15 n=1 Tax=Caerostris extrusa TaxID=172846 RepID=A0AAV4N2I2_CAEEX|nr:uncharacterized protein CEXT_537061 [Caerostris extrusa]